MAFDTGSRNPRQRRVGPSTVPTYNYVPPVARRSSAAQQAARTTSALHRAIRGGTSTPTPPTSRPRTLVSALSRLEQPYGNPLIQYTQDETGSLAPGLNALGGFFHDFIQKELASKRYTKEWRQARSSYQTPSLSKMPKLSFVPRGEGPPGAQAFATQNRQTGRLGVHLMPIGAYGLAHSGPEKQYARTVNLHEWRHNEQAANRPGGLPTEALREGDAQLFAEHLANQLFGIPRTVSRNAYDENYVPFVAQQKRRYGPILQQGWGP